MKRFFLYILIIAMLISCFAGCSNGKKREVGIIPLPVEDRLAMIDSFFANGDFEGVKSLYKEATGEDYQIIEDYIISYADLYIDSAKQNLSTKALEEFKRTGYEGNVITEGIALVERLIVSEAAYKEGKIAFNGRDFETAKEKLNIVDTEHTNYDTARQCLIQIAERERAWHTSRYGRNQGTYGLASDEEFVYMSYRHNGVFGILKVDLNGEYTEFIPLSDAADYVITGINIVGDYLYFIAGENVGRGLMFNNPYCIYEMKTDGSGLAQVAQGDYFDLRIHGRKVYALSYTKGLVQMDENFVEQGVLSSDRVIEMCGSPEGIYYTVQSSLGSENENTIYLYDGETHQEILTDSFAHYYIYDQNVLRLVSVGSNKEKLVIETRDDEKQIASADILKVYGLIGDRVIYSTPGNDAQERLKEYSITTGKEETYQGSSELPEFYITGLCYNSGKIFAVNAKGIYVMETDFSNPKALEIAEVDKEKLSANKALLRHIGDSDLYSPEEDVIVVLSDEQLWHYSDANLNITMEKRYLEETECTAYITHIYTNDYDLITTDSWGDRADSRSTAKPEDIADKYGIIYGQSTDYFNYDDEARRGIIIRKGEVYRDYIYRNMLAIYPDGTFVTYEKGDTISAERLVEDGVKTTFSFGPILVKDSFLSPSAPISKVAVRNPRSSIGMVEPGHYVSIVVDGRSSESRGLTTVALGELFVDEGCTVAYNLDGGGTASVIFLGNLMYLETHYRNIPDMLYFGSSDIVPLDIDDYTLTFEQYTSTETQVQE